MRISVLIIVCCRACLKKVVFYEKTVYNKGMVVLEKTKGAV